MTREQKAREIVEKWLADAMERRLPKTSKIGLDILSSLIAEALPEPLNDEEIEEEADSFMSEYHEGYDSFINGAKWAREKMMASSISLGG